MTTTSNNLSVPENFDSEDILVEQIIQRLGKSIVVATPLGLGKPNQLLNALYQRAKDDSSISLKIITALSLTVPVPQSDLEKRFAEPFLKRVYTGYVEMDYVKDQIEQQLPVNIQVHEFYFSPGSFLKNSSAQQNYISSNYTFVTRDLLLQKVNLVLQLIANDENRSPDHYSLSCNPDISLDLHKQLLDSGIREQVLFVGQTHAQLPYMLNDAEVPANFFDLILDNRKNDTTLFSVPNTHVSLVDHLIGLHASTLIKDAGTLQIGIGAMSDAIVHACLLRHKNNEHYNKALGKFNIDSRYTELIDQYGGTDTFDQGLYGASEMFVNGFRYLIDADIIKRKVYRQSGTEKNGIIMHGCFFLGPSDFYQWLRDLSPEKQKSICMTSVSNVNRLDNDFDVYTRQRQHARFINSGLIATLNGSVASDGLENGQVISGVGGQYNFVAMAHQLKDARSILMVRATRHDQQGKLQSNIKFSYGHTTIPRHLRDIVITEYGIADLRAKSDQDIYKSMLNIADSNFQEILLQQAKASGKIETVYRIPEEFQNNFQHRLQQSTSGLDQKAVFPMYPFGEEFTDSEEDLIIALKKLKALAQNRTRLIKESLKAAMGKQYKTTDDRIIKALIRMRLEQPKRLKDKISANLLVNALTSSDPSN